MVNHYYDPETQTVMVEIHCGCCGLFFKVGVGGSCFCDNCLHGEHQGCGVKFILGIKEN